MNLLLLAIPLGYFLLTSIYFFFRDELTRPTQFHCYFVVKDPEGSRYFSIQGSLWEIQDNLNAYFKCYPFPRGFWGRLMTLDDFKMNPSNNKNVLCPIQTDTGLLDGLLK